MRFLNTLRIPVIATLRDSQNYVRAAEQGVGLHEMKKTWWRRISRIGSRCSRGCKAKEAAGPPRHGVNTLPESA